MERDDGGENGLPDRHDRAERRPGAAEPGDAGELYPRLTRLGGRPARRGRPPFPFLPIPIKTSSRVCLPPWCVPQLTTSVPVVRVEPIIGIGSPMQSLAQWSSGVEVGDPALLLAIAAGLVVMLVLLLLGRRRQPAHEFRPPVSLPSTGLGSTDWESPLPSTRHDERRRSIRRTGLPTPILVVDPKGGKRARAAEAYVLDRSSGGLRLALEKPYGVGLTLLRQAVNAPDGFQWVRVTVKNCREVGDYFEVGCQFESELELSRLLMFG